MSVIRMRLLAACVVALGIALGAAILAGQTGGNATKAGGNAAKAYGRGDSSGVTRARPGILRRIRSMPPTWQI